MDIQITFRDFPPSDTIREYVEKRAAKVLAHAGRVTGARVTLAAPHRHHHQGHSYRVGIDVLMPGHEIVVSPRDGADGHGDLYAAIDDAFDDADRQIREYRGHQKDARNGHAH